MRTCSVCSRPDRPELDAALVRGDSLRDISGRFGTSKSALARHRPHVGKALIKAEAARQDGEAETLLDKVKALEADAHRLKRKAEDGDDLRAALVAVDKLLEIVRLYGDLMPAPSPSPADEARVLEWMAAETGTTVGELRAEAEKFARIGDEIRAGRMPVHTARPVPSPPTVMSAIASAAEAARQGTPAPAPPPVVASPSSAVTAPPPPFRMSV